MKEMRKCVPDESGYYEINLMEHGSGGKDQSVVRCRARFMPAADGKKHYWVFKHGSHIFFTCGDLFIPNAEDRNDELRRSIDMDALSEEELNKLTRDGRDPYWYRHRFYLEVLSWMK